MIRQGRAGRGGSTILTWVCVLGVFRGEQSHDTRAILFHPFHDYSDSPLLNAL
jgi:hypothetical protein